MPSAVAPNPRAGSAAPDDLDKLFNYDDAVEDFLKDLPLDKDQQNNNASNHEPAKNIDEEITVKKKRKPNPKLDESLLQSEKGLPKLRKITKSRLKFRGKGHEFSDISKLLDTYQLWLDELYPRVKFRDGLAMVEKLGHSKRMQVMRRAWLDETKPSAMARDPSPEKDEGEDTTMSGALPTDQPATEQRQDADDEHSRHTPPGSPQAQQQDEAPGDDELDALMAENEAAFEPALPPPRRQKAPFDEDEDEDELDALLAEQSALDSGQPADAQSSRQVGSPKRKDPFDDFADDEEAMAEMGW